MENTYLMDEESGPGTVDPVDAINGNLWTDSDEPPDVKGMVTVAIDWAELEGALENNSPDLHSFFNKETGDVIRIFSGNESVERRLQEVEADPAYLYIEPISSREQYRWMEEFIEEIEDCPLKQKLVSAVDGKGAFRRFKDALADDSEKRELWFARRSVKLQAHIAEWLKAKNITPANASPWEEGASTRKFETVRRNRYGTASRTQGASQRRAAHELVDLIRPSDLHLAVAFLEFLGRHYQTPEND